MPGRLVLHNKSAPISENGPCGCGLTLSTSKNTLPLDLTRSLRREHHCLSSLRMMCLIGLAGARRDNTELQEMLSYSVLLTETKPVHL